MKSRLLYLNTHRLAAYAWQQGQLRLEGSFDSNEEGWRGFADYLRQNNGSPYSLLVNVAEEGHVVETIPFLRGQDRQTLLTRKIGQHFLGSPLACATSLGYEKTQRRNEKLLLSALTNPAHLDPWLKRIEQARAPLAGIHTVAQLGGTLLKKLGLANPRCLLLTLQDHSIRQSYVVDGHVRFSRMAPLADSSIAGIASAFSAEAGKLHQYLIGQRLIGRDESLPVFIVVHPFSQASVEKACPNRGPLHFSFIDSHVAAARIGLHTRPEDNRCDPLFLHLLAVAAPSQQFAGEAHRHYYRLMQLRRGLIGAGLVILLGSALYSAREMYVADSLRTETASLAAGESDLGRRYQELSAAFPQTGLNNESLRQITNRYNELRAQQRQPGGLYSLISQALDQVPSVTLDEIDWKNGRFFQSTAGTPPDLREAALVRASIRIDRANPRQTLAVFERFVQILREQPGLIVNVQQRPLEIESGTALRGGDGQEEQTAPRPFVVEIIREGQS